MASKTRNALTQAQDEAAARISVLAKQISDEMTTAMFLLDQAGERIETAGVHFRYLLTQLRSSRETLLGVTQQMDSLSQPAAQISVISINHMDDCITALHTVLKCIYSVQETGIFGGEE